MTAIWGAVDLRQGWPMAVGAAAVLVAIGLAVYARLLWHKERRMAETPTRRIDQLRPGFVEVRGRAKPARAALISPLSRTECIYYRFVVKEHVRRGKHSHWRTRIDDVQDAGCLVFDGSGTVAVRLSEAELHLDPGLHARSGTFQDAPPHLEATLQGYGQSSVGWVFNKTMRYSETVLREGQQLYVLGTAARLPDGTYELRKEGDLFLVSDKSEQALAERLRNRRLLSAFGAAAAGAVSVGLAVWRLLG